MYLRFCLVFFTALLPLKVNAADPEDAWQLLATATFEEFIEGDNWRVEKTYPAELRKAAKDFEVRGFFVPVIAQGAVTEFLLVEDPADCPFCGSGGYGPVLEVKSKRPMPDLAEFAEITVRGQLEFNESNETLQMYLLKDAILVK